jgi:FkbM family methyltransferase
MTTSYFILSKTTLANDISDDSKNQIIYLNSSLTYLLPKVNIDYYTHRGLFENRLIDWSKQLCSKDKVFLDIGAHTGTYSISMADRCQHIYAFEPQKMTYYALCGGVALSNIQNITCINSGLGSEDQVGKQVLKIVSMDGGGSSMHASSGILREEEISVATLDSFNLSNIGFIKMDVEENELFVLKGGVKTLKRSNFPKILFESNTEDRALFEYIYGLGYQIVKIGGYSNMYLAEV